MLQRVQSLYLFAGIVLSIAILFSSIFYVSNETDSLLLGAFGPKEGSLVIEMVPMIPVAILAGITIALQGYAIAIFKNRKLQINVIRISLLLTLLLLAYLGYVYFSLSQNQFKIIPFMGVMHAPLVVFANIMAIRGIKKDEALVKSVDRLR